MKLHTAQSHVRQTQPMAFPSGSLPLDSDSFVDAVQLVRVPADQVASVKGLREEIDLSVHAAAGPQFELLEKKETSAALCLRSIFMASGSARFASCHWATA